MSDDLVSRLRQDAEMLQDGPQSNLTKLWHSEVVKDAAKDCQEAAQALTEARAEIETKTQAIADMARQIYEMQSKHDTLRARVREVVGPFAKYVEVTDSDWAHDSSEIGCTIVNGLRHSIKLGHLRAARQLNEDLK